MIKRIIPLGFDSFGVRSMSTYVETDDHKILIDPGVALAPMRYGLEPHPIELQRMSETWTNIRDYAEDSDTIIVTHYHYDHHEPNHPEIYRDKKVFIKHPTANINQSQRERAAFFLEAIRGKPQNIEVADGGKYRLGKTMIKFSEALFHGVNSRLGYVIEVSIESGNEKFVHTSDVEGPSIEAQVKFIIDENPDILFVDGPMTYMLGYRYPFESLEAANANMLRVLRSTKVHTVVLDHHLLRDLNYRVHVKPVYEEAKSLGIKVVTAAEFAGRAIEMLEALRRELYAKSWQ
ncbi:MAG: MBL fold metallo-hydrolase [Candidatus Parvarchaeota archaeon]